MKIVVFEAEPREAPVFEAWRGMLWEDLVTVQDDEAAYASMVDNQAIVIPDTIGAIRALTGREEDSEASMARTNASLGVGTSLV